MHINHWRLYVAAFYTGHPFNTGHQSLSLTCLASWSHIRHLTYFLQSSAHSLHRLHPQTPSSSLYYFLHHPSCSLSLSVSLTLFLLIHSVYPLLVYSYPFPVAANHLISPISAFQLIIHSPSTQFQLVFPHILYISLHPSAQRCTLARIEIIVLFFSLFFSIYSSPRSLSHTLAYDPTASNLSWVVYSSQGLPFLPGFNLARKEAPNTGHGITLTEDLLKGGLRSYYSHLSRFPAPLSTGHLVIDEAPLPP